MPTALPSLILDDPMGQVQALDRHLTGTLPAGTAASCRPDAPIGPAPQPSGWINLASASLLAFVVIHAVIPQAITATNQTALARIWTQPDMARPYSSGQSGMSAVIS